MDLLIILKIYLSLGSIFYLVIIAYLIFKRFPPTKISMRRSKRNVDKTTNEANEED